MAFAGNMAAHGVVSAGAASVRRAAARCRRCRRRRWRQSASRSGAGAPLAPHSPAADGAGSHGPPANVVQWPASPSWRVDQLAGPTAVFDAGACALWRLWRVRPPHSPCGPCTRPAAVHTGSRWGGHCNRVAGLSAPTKAGAGRRAEPSRVGCRRWLWRCCRICGTKAASHRGVPGVTAGAATA